MIIQIVNSKSKSCSKCSGSLSLGEDQFGTYFQCLMCGRIADIQQTDGKPAHRSNPFLNDSILMGALNPA